MRKSRSPQATSATNCLIKAMEIKEAEKKIKTKPGFSRCLAAVGQAGQGSGGSLWDKGLGRDGRAICQHVRCTLPIQVI